MKKNYLYISLLLLFSLNVASIPFLLHAYTFSRSLKVGDNGADVLELQKVLNSSVDTQISSSGVGSKGQESMYFGNLTQQAVIKYQNKYRTDILTPSGLTYGTGFVGPATIKKLNNKGVLSASATPSTGGYAAYVPRGLTSQTTVPSTYQVYDPQQPTSSTLSPKPQLTTPPPVTQPVGPALVYAFAPREIKPGGIITIYGRNLPTSGLVASLGGIPLTNLTVTNSSEMTAKIPETIAPSTYKLTFSHPSLTISIPNIPNFSLSPTISLSPRPQPKISTVSPINVSVDDLITIKGTGFTQDNAISTPMGTIEHVASSDGVTLTFKPSQLSRISQAAAIRQKSISKTGIAVSVVVINEGGFSTDAVYFVIK